MGAVLWPNYKASKILVPIIVDASDVWMFFLREEL